VKCDLCLEDVLPDQPRRGGVAPLGMERHWSCHVEKFGEPVRTSTVGLFAELRAAISNPAVVIEEKAPMVVKTPKVKTGALNRSPNAARSFKFIRVISEMGKRRGLVHCPFCCFGFWAYVWSLSGGGKKCPNCGAMHTGHGQAYPIEGNEEL
jgi:hypothetical protein